MELSNIDIRSEYYTTIHDMKPRWWMRWGVLSVLLIFLLMVLCGWMIKYPDVITCEIKLTTNKASVTLPVYPKAQIERVLVKNGAHVTLNDHLLIVRNNAKYEDVIFLCTELEKFTFEKDYMIRFFDRFLSIDLKLGDVIENDWNVFSNELLIYYKIEALNSYKTQIAFLEKELVRYYVLKQQYEKLILVDLKQKDLLDKKAKVDSILYQQDVTSFVENVLNKQDYLSKHANLETNRLALNRINLEIVKLQNALEHHRITERENLITQRMSIRKALNKLLSSIDSWKKTYLIMASTDGQVSFVQDLQDGRFIEGNVFTIVPYNDRYYATINIPIMGAGKVKTGQRVMMKINDYPYKEYGVLEGRLIELYELSNDKFYLGKVRLDRTDRSSYDRKILIRENMSGVGDIITNDRSLLERLFQTILYAFRKR